MKLRIHDDSVRLRLTRGEVDRIGHGLGVEATCRFAEGAALRYALVVQDVATISARYGPGCIEVALPRAMAAEWAASNTVSLRSEPGALPALLIEKDFACLEPRDGDDPADLYPNPKARRS